MMAHRSILDYFHHNARQRSGKTAALVKRGGVYQSVTWGEMGADAERISAGLIALGVNPGDRVSIISQTRLEWVTIDMGILGAGAVTVPIYSSNLPDECQHILDDSGAVVVFAETPEQTAKFRAERARLGHVRQIVQLEGDIAEKDGWVMTFKAFLEGGRVDKEELAHRASQLTKDSILTIIYTSGTTGKPKGVICSHDNMMFEAEAVAAIDLIRDVDVQLFFLPLAHVFAKLLEVVWIAQAHVMAFAENMGTIKENLAEVRPTVMAGVPRIFEKFYAAVVQKGQSGSPLARQLFGRAMSLSERNAEARAKGKRLGVRDTVKYELMKRLVFAKVGKGLKQSLGGRIRYLVSGGAPLSPKIAYFFQDAGVEVLEGFGMTESSAATCVNRPGRNHIGTVGLPVPGVEVRLASDGELLLRGRGITRGYWNNEAATKEVLLDGWLTTGDVARLESDGTVRIIDRKKDLIVTAGGKNVAPQNIENLIKTCPIVSQVVVHGDKRNFLSALVTVEAEALKRFATDNNLGDGSYAELSQRPEVFKEVQSAIETFNRQLPSYETIKKFKILEHDFSQESGEMTPSLKIKRKVVNQRYQKIFDAFYEASY